MCIIACKPIGIDMPDADTITNMWYSNPDGAGFMYNHDGRVHISKGYMKLDKFLEAIDKLAKKIDLTRTGVVMHFRITTHGGTKPENTHPFPVSDSLPMLRKLTVSAKLGVAHNGIIDITPRSKDISDTMEYVMSQLAPLSRALPRFYENKDAMLMVKNAIDSKMAFLTPEGMIHTIGDFNMHNGILYSNPSYEAYWHSMRYGKFSVWDRDEDKWDTYGYGDWGYPYTYSGSNKSLAPAKYDDDEDSDEEIVTRILMPVMDVDGAYLKDLKDGTLFEDCNYEWFMDSAGNPWWFSESEELAYRDPDVALYDASGQPLRFDPDLAFPLDCVEFGGHRV